MSYRGVNKRLLRDQTHEIMRNVGHTATWRQWVSAGDGFDDLGLGDTQYYREQVITALFYESYQRQGETQRNVGMIAEGMFAVSTRECLGRQDELQWRGITYRIESDPQPSVIAGLWMTLLKRGE